MRRVVVLGAMVLSTIALQAQILVYRYSVKGSEIEHLGMGRVEFEKESEKGYLVYDSATGIGTVLEFQEWGVEEEDVSFDVASGDGSGGKVVMMYAFEDGWNQRAIILTGKAKTVDGHALGGGPDVDLAASLKGYQIWCEDGYRYAAMSTAIKLDKKFTVMVNDQGLSRSQAVDEVVDSVTSKKK